MTIGNLFSLILNFSFTLLVLYFLCFNLDEVFDYENFRYSTITTIFLVLLVLYTSIKRVRTKNVKIDINDDHLVIEKDQIASKLSFSSIEGISNWFDNITIHLKNGNKYKLSESNITNTKEVQKILNKETEIKKLPFYRSSSRINIGICLLGLLYFIGSGLFYSGKEELMFPFLPMQSVKVVSIEGTITNRTTDTDLKDSYVENKETLDGTKLGALIYLVEYPKLRYTLPFNSRLKDKILNFEDKVVLKEDLRVQLKIRKSDYEKLNNMTPKRKRDTTIPFYYLKVMDEVFYEKEHLKDVEID